MFPISTSAPAHTATSLVAVPSSRWMFHRRMCYLVQPELSQGASGGVTCLGGPAGSQLGLGPLPSSTQTLFTDSQAPQAASLDWHTPPPL